MNIEKFPVVYKSHQYKVGIYHKVSTSTWSVYIYEKKRSKFEIFYKEFKPSDFDYNCSEDLFIKLTEMAFKAYDKEWDECEEFYKQAACFAVWEGNA